MEAPALSSNLHAFFAICHSRQLHIAGIIVSSSLELDPISKNIIQSRDYLEIIRLSYRPFNLFS